MSDAQSLQQQLFHEKLKKGYNDIMSLNYHGTMTLQEVETHLEYDQNAVIGFAGKTETEKPEPEKLVTLDFEEPKKKQPSPKHQSTFVVRCVNNLGIEHRFVIGEEYNAENIDCEMYKVVDMTGIEAEVFAERFEKVK